MPPVKTPPELLEPIRIDRVLDLEAWVDLDARALEQLALREINVKEAFTLVDADGTFFRASRKEEKRALVYERFARSPESPARITLACAVLARQRMLPVVQKATELGCVRIVPLQTDCSVPARELAREKPWAWAGQALKGARQCRRATLPEVKPILPLADALASRWWKNATACFVMDDTLTAADPFAGFGPHGDYVLAVGPEGGWSEREREALRTAGARPLVLGARVLRAETAVFAGLAILQHRLGDLR
jgi:16S rRNA (uracil1498-N3)-methyltransferase